MAMSISNLVRQSHKLFSNEISGKYLVNAVRQLYSPVAMNIDGFVRQRDIHKSRLPSGEDSFRNKVKEALASNSMTFSEDLKIMSHIVNDSTEDFELLVNMIKKYCSQTELRANDVINGTVAMRAFYYLNQPVVALEMIQNVEVRPFFEQLTTYQILMGLLYKNGMYKECRDTYELIKSKIDRHMVLSWLVFGACYKENTPESFDYAMKLFKDFKSKEQLGIGRRASFLSALALKQNKPEIALELLVGLQRENAGQKSLKVLANLQLKRYDDIDVVFKEAIKRGGPNLGNKFFKDVIQKVEAELGSIDQSHPIHKSLPEIKQRGYVDDKNLEEYLTAEIDGRPRKNRFNNNNQQFDGNQQFENIQRLSNNQQSGNQQFNNRQFNNQRFANNSRSNFQQTGRQNFRRADGTQSNQNRQGAEAALRQLNDLM